ncbi:Cytochrome P450 6B7 [Blattella germanica]|nr:Cytochrome P450 6B7 [Blattella germanica]
MVSLNVDSWWLVYTAGAAVLVYLYLTWTHKYWEKKGIPYLEPKLFFGAIKDNILGKRTLGQCYEECYW